MGYACPVCDVPQRDAEHLANHLAFTAILRGEAHEAWLDETLPGWSEDGPDELAERVVAHADDADYEEVFEDTANAGHGDHADVARGGGHGHGSDGAALDDDAAAALDEARALTREMYGLDDGAVDGRGDSAVDGRGDSAGDDPEESADGGRGDGAVGGEEDASDDRGDSAVDDRERDDA